MRDGRLTGPELGAFARHMATCGACADEAKAHDVLAEALRNGRGEPVDELHVARERTRLLAAFDRSLLATERGRSERWFLPLTAAIALACGIFIFSRSRPVEPPSAPSNVVIGGDRDAVWSKHVEAGGEKVVLVRGALAIHVDHRISRGERLIVLLPDGELEDIGTTFTVAAANGHTQRVTVQEGSVLLRLHGRSPVALSAGESWTANLAPRASGAPIALPPPAAERPARLGPSRKETVAASPATLTAPSVGDDASEDFRAVVRLLDAGDDCQAAAGLHRFASQHPSDSRAEDAAYLRVIALRRCGAPREMRQAALEYLNAYPDGFRHAEVERLSQ
jgi:hypothetical protein